MKAKFFLSIFLTVFLLADTYSQISVSGANCVVPGLPYQYEINGVDSASSIKICVTGGQILNSTPDCAETTPVNRVKIRWEGSGDIGTITVTSSTGNAALSISLAFPLDGGNIDSSQVVQTVDFTTVPRELICTNAAGGNCNPLYQYQWQSSPDNQEWTEISGKTGANLHFSSQISTTTYFRRKTLERVSNTIAYSNTVLMIISKAPGQ